MVGDRIVASPAIRCWTKTQSRDAKYFRGAASSFQEKIGQDQISQERKGLFEDWDTQNEIAIQWEVW
jgi:hypothetical protein